MALLSRLAFAVGLMVGAAALHADDPAQEPNTPPDAGSDAVGALAGSFRVNEQGAASYTVPFTVPAGTAGETPQIALSYSSGSGNGLVGQGWSIAGLSGISRCRKTLYQDVDAKPISWGANDRFCLDGERLVLGTGAHYGAVGATYRTEQDSYAKITSVGGADGAPDYFTVEGKDGVTRTYGAPGSGAATDAEQEARDGSGNETGKVLTWALARLTDSVGNRIEFSYFDDVYGHRIKEIRYAWGALGTPGARIYFVYSSSNVRSDPLSAYVGGYEFRIEKRLIRVEVYGRDSADVQSIVRSYSLQYGASSASDRLSRLASMQECNDTTATVCHPSTSLAWTIPASGFAGTPSFQELNYFDTEIPVYSKPADVNGDGKMDLVWEYGNVPTQGNTELELRLALSDGTTLVQSSWVADMLNVENYKFTFHVIDYNNDGYADVLRPNKATNTWVVHLSNGTSLESTYIDTGIALVDAEKSLASDLNADGLADLVYHKGNEQYAARLMTWTPNQGVSGFSATETPVTFDPPAPAPGVTWSFHKLLSSSTVDFNGDGMADLVGVVQKYVSGLKENKYLVVYTQTTLGRFTPMYVFSGDVEPDEVQAIPGDVNGDGLTDLLYSPKDSSTWRVFINTGTAFYESQDLGTLSGDKVLVQFTDYNRDGHPDVLFGNTAKTVLSVRLYDPQNGQYQASIDTTIGLNYTQRAANIYQFMDVTGDGHLESVHFNTQKVWQNENGNADLEIREFVTHGATTAVNTIGTITDGLGAQVQMTYGALNNPGVHAPEHDANAPWPLLAYSQSLGKLWPVIDVKPQSFVVTQARSSAPTAGATPGLGNVDPAALSVVNYAYAGAKMQGAGVGFLGFHQILSVDVQTGMWSWTTYRQDYPFVGRAMTTEVYQDLGNWQLQLVSSNNDWWALQDWGAHTSAPFPLYRLLSLETRYDLVSGSPFGQHLTRIVKADGTVGQDAWGNVLEMQVTQCGDPGADPDCATPESTVTTVNTYGSGSGYDQEKGRLSQTVVTHSRPNTLAIVRKSTFAYYTSGAQKGLLSTETVDPDNGLHTRTTTHTYDAFGNRIKTSVVGKVDGVANQMRYTRWGYDTRGRFVNATYLWTGNTAVAAPPGGVAGELLTEQVTARNALGEPLTVIGDQAVTTRIRYGSLGREYQRYDSTGAYTTAFYTTGAGSACPGGLTAYFSVSTAAGGGSGFTCYDKIGRAVRKATRGFDGSYIYSDTTFDNAGRVRHQSQPYYYGGAAYWSTLSYDALGRLTSLLDPKGGTTTNAYAYRLTTVTDPAGHQRQEQRNPLGEVIRVSDHQALNGSGATAGATIENDYDATGNLIEVQLKTAGTNLATGVPGTITTTIGYDAWGRKTSLADPDKGTWTYTWNAFDELIRQLDAKGKRSDLGYDPAGRLIGRSDFRADATRESDTTWVFDWGLYFGNAPGRALGVVQSLKDATGTAEVGSVVRVESYDSLKRPSGSLVALDGSGGPGNQTQTIEYDQYGRVLKRLDATGDGRGVLYHYNANGYRDTISEAAPDGAVYATVLAMDAWGHVTQEQLGPDTGNPYAPARVTTRSFEPERGLAGTIRTADPNGANDIQDTSYTWDAVGNLTSRRDQGGATRNSSESYTYDTLNRLRTVTLNGTQTDTIGYDAFGNLKTKTGVGTYSYGHDNGQQPHTVTATSTGSRTYGYDPNGNLVTDSTGRTLAYASFDKPTSIVKGSRQVAFGYGPAREVYKRVDTVGGVATTTWTVGGIEIVQKPDGSSDVRRYLDGVAEVVIHKSSAGAVTGTDTRYLLHDHLGSVTGFVDGTALAAEQAFDGWGCREDAGWNSTCMSTTSPTYATITALTKKGFTSHEHVDELNVIHMSGRTYDTKIGRFMQADIVVQSPFDTQGYNRYSYLTNNPLNGTDPSGYFGLKDLREYTSIIVGGALLTWNPLGYGLWQSAMYGAIAGGSGAAANGGNILQSAALGAFTSAAMFGVGSYFQGVEGAACRPGTYEFGDQYLTPGEIVGKVAAHGVVGGTASVLGGGKFGHGFAAAGFGEAVTGSGIGELGNGVTATGGEATIAAIAGGTASVLSGGKFANGAVTGAFGYLFNSLAHPDPNDSTFVHGIRNAILRGDANELRTLLGNVGSELSSSEMAMAKRALTAMETVGAEDRSMLAGRYGVNWANKVGKVFEGMHEGPIGDALISKFGYPGRAFAEVQRSVESLRPSTNIFTGRFDTAVNVQGITVEVRGRLIDGVYRIGTVLKSP